MNTVETLALFGVFGVLCAHYLSVVGFVLTAVAIVFLLGMIDATGFHHFGFLLLAAAFVTMQLGYFLGVVGTALSRHLRGASSKDPRRIKGEHRINQE